MTFFIADLSVSEFLSNYLTYMIKLNKPIKYLMQGSAAFYRERARQRFYKKNICSPTNINKKMTDYQKTLFHKNNILLVLNE